MALHPLFPGVPGGVELLVILLMMVVPLVLVGAAYLFGKRRGPTESGSDDPPESVE